MLRPGAVSYTHLKAAEEASYEEYKANLRRNAQNFRITDEHLGEGLSLIHICGGNARNGSAGGGRQPAGGFVSDRRYYLSSYPAL